MAEEAFDLGQMHKDVQGLLVIVEKMKTAIYVQEQYIKQLQKVAKDHEIVILKLRQYIKDTNRDQR